MTLVTQDKLRELAFHCIFDSRPPPHQHHSHDGIREVPSQCACRRQMFEEKTEGFDSAPLPCSRERA